MDSDKCAHPACECQVVKGGKWGKYCGEHCKHAAQLSELRCYCQHPECRAASQAPSHAADLPAR